MEPNVPCESCTASARRQRREFLKWNWRVRTREGLEHYQTVQGDPLGTETYVNQDSCWRLQSQNQLTTTSNFLSDPCVRYRYRITEETLLCAQNGPVGAARQRKFTLVHVKLTSTVSHFNRFRCIKAQTGASHWEAGPQMGLSFIAGSINARTSPNTRESSENRSVFRRNIQVDNGFQFQMTNMNPKISSSNRF